MSQTPTTRLEDLLGHADWLRRLAAHLVREGDETEDLMQETWEAALRRSPDPARPPQPWLAEVLRNLVRARGRRDRLHRRFENQARLEPSTVPSSEALLERAESQRLVAELVVALDEPYRSTILLRYYEGLSGAQIAAALGLPPGTVRWRLKEGVDRLRAALKVRFGKDERWTMALVPLAARQIPLDPLKGVLLMAAKTKLGALGGLLAVLATLGGALVWRGVARRRPTTTSTVGQRARAPSVARPRAVLESWARAGGGQPGSISGTVCDPAGRAASGARIALVAFAAYEDMEDKTALRPRGDVLAEADGSFRFTRVTPGVYLLTATAEGWAPAERTDVALLPGESLANIELRLARGGVKLRGGVSDAGGGPVAGAAIRALALGAGRRLEAAHTFLGASDGRGQYSIDLTRGSYRVVADADGYVPTSVEVALDGDQSHDFRLTPAARISGHVIERGGGPVRGATVRLQSDALIKPESRVTTADVEGAFLFRNLSPGSFRLSARSGALVGVAPHKVTVALAGAATNVVIELSRGLAIAGRVVDAVGKPVPGARVRLDEDAASSLSGSDGRYRLEGVSPGHHTVTGEATNHSPARATVALDRADAEAVDLTLGLESTIDGRVLGRDGAPVARASVTALVVRADALSEVVTSAAVARTDDRGRFHLGGLGSGGARVEAEQAEAGRGVAGPFALEAGQTRTVDVRLGRGGMIRGTVYWDDRSPARNVVAGGHQPGRPGCSTTTDQEGRYEIGPFPSGDVTVTARPEIDPLGGGSEVRRVSLAPAEDKDGVDLVVPRHDREISGVVLAPDGTPSPGATVGASAEYNGVSWRPYNKYADAEGGNYTVLSDSDGNFTVEHLPKGTFTVWAIQAGLPEADAFQVPVGSRGVRVRFTPGATLGGRVVSARGDPVTTYTVHAILSPSNDATAELRAARGYVQDTQFVQDASGAFEITGLHPAFYDVLVTTPDGRGGRVTGIPLEPGQRRRDLRVTVAEGVRLKGHVVDADGQRPIANVSVVAWLAMLKEQVSGVSDATGAFVLDGVVPGTIDLSLRGAPGTKQVGTRSLRVPEGQREFDAGTLTLGRRSPRP
jgi:RNA polymerase sigma factor (sigma-70 family)